MRSAARARRPWRSSGLKCRFVPARKVGKLPPGRRNPLLKQSFTKEYGDDAFELSGDHIMDSIDSINAIIVDDVLATGGSMVAACRLVDSLPFNVSVKLIVTLLDVPALRPTWRAALDAYTAEVAAANADVEECARDLYKVAVCM